MMFVSALLLLTLSYVTTTSAAPTNPPALALEFPEDRAAASDRSMQEFLKEAMQNSAGASNGIYSRRDGNGCINTFHDFTNYKGQPGYVDFVGNTAFGPNGFRMFSDPGSESRMRYGFTFNDGSAAYTNIWVSMRGAPDSGRTSYAKLQDSNCFAQPNNCDNIHVVDVFGGSDARFSYFGVSNGFSGGGYPFPNTGNNAAGHDFMTYKIYLERGNFLKSTIALSNGLEIGSQTFNQGIPTNPLNLYLGIFPCSWNPSGGFCGPNYQGGSWMEISFIYYQTCN